jgi:transcription factor SOX7/8/10/18 (SOX group E/F)
MYNQNASFDANSGLPGMSSLGAQIPTQTWGSAQTLEQGEEGLDNEEGEGARRPPNAFILYTQEMRSAVRQDNPSLSNTECSRLLGKMWKEVPNNVKLQYKTKAQALQEEFKRTHPDYTYRKARRKRALNELLTRSTQGYNTIGAAYSGEMGSWNNMIQQNPNMVQQMMNNSQPQGMSYSQVAPGSFAGLGYSINTPSFPMSISYPNSMGGGGQGGVGASSLYGIDAMSSFSVK